MLVQRTWLFGLALALAAPGLALPGTADAATLPRSLAETDGAVAILVVEPTRYADVMGRLDALGLPHHGWPRLSMMSAYASGDDLRALARWPGVVGVHENRVLHGALDDAAPYVGASQVWSDFGATGKGVGVLVVDTGVDGNHPDVEYGRNLVENVAYVSSPVGADQADMVFGSKEGTRASDGDGHGTHVAGIVGGTARGLNEAGSAYRGVAYGATLVGFQAGLRNDDTGESDFQTQTILEAFHYALDNRDRFGLRIVTNSWGGNGEFDPHDPINEASLALYKSGLAVFFAAGNEGDTGPGSLNLYCVAPWVLCVTAGDYYNRRAPFSSLGSDEKPYDHPDIMAPGKEIVAARSSGDTTALTGAADVGGLLGGRVTTASALYTTKSGTSMATPVVSGTAALLFEGNPDLSPDDVYDILVSTSLELKDPVREVGAGYLNALKAFRLAQQTNGTNAAFLAGHWKYAGPDSGDGNYSRDAVTVGYGVNVNTNPSNEGLVDVARSLVGTTSGLMFLAGIVVLALLAFRRTP